MSVRRIVDIFVGMIEGLLLVRLVGLLFAARPDNRALDLVFDVVAPLVWPWTWLDRLAGQPRFGARLELATIAAMLMIGLLYAIGHGVHIWRERRKEGLDG